MSSESRPDDIMILTVSLEAGVVSAGMRRDGVPSPAICSLLTDVETSERVAVE